MPHLVRTVVVSMRTRSLAGFALMALCAGSHGACARRDAKPRCANVLAKDNSPSTRAVFAAKHCQGGGVTWAALLGVLVERRGSSKAVEESVPGWTGDVRTLSWSGGVARVAIDEEGDSARFCADSDRLLAEILGEVKRLNAEPRELERAMAEANPLALECLPDGVSPTALLKGMNSPSPPSPAEAEARQRGRARSKEALDKQRTWCWRKSGVAFNGKGGLTLHADGRVTAFNAADAPREGRWSFEDDGRIEVLLPKGIHHFDVGETGHLGFDYAGGREELDACAPPPG